MVHMVQMDAPCELYWTVIHIHSHGADMHHKYAPLYWTVIHIHSHGADGCSLHRIFSHTAAT